MVYKTIRAVGRVFFYLLVGKTKIIGKENMEAIKEGPAIICANHKSNWDPVILADAFDRPICFMAKKSLFKNKLMAKILYKAGTFPVDRTTNDIASIKNAIKVLKSSEMLGIFPEGKRNDDGYVHEFLDGLSMIAHKTKSMIIPVGITNKVGLFRRPVIKVGKPIIFTELFDEKPNSKLFKQMNEVIHKEVSNLAYPTGEKIDG